MTRHSRFARGACGFLLAAAFAGAAGHALASPPPAYAAGVADPWYIGYSAEYSWNYSLGMIKAASAYSRGYTGAGQTVAVFDSGLDETSNQFIGRIAGPGYNAVTGTVGVTTDAQWHGTFVSGLIAADRDGIGMMGVAYQAKILPIRVVNANGTVTVSDTQLAGAISYAQRAGARVFNNSWNSTASLAALSKSDLDAAIPATLAAYRAAVRSGAVVVFAAGNNNGGAPGFYAALPVYYPELRAGWLAAVAVDSSGAIASYSARCGAAAAWCLAAPGSNAISVYQGGYGIGSGTSFATPVLSAAVAILKQEFPYLSNQQILTILLASANKSGIYANTAIYGQGLLDLNRATQPIGALVLRVARTLPVSLGSSFLNLGAAFGGGFMLSLADHPVLVNDSFGRGYTVGLASLVTVNASDFDLQSAFDSFGGDLHSTVRKGVRMSYAFTTDRSGTVVPARFMIEQDTGSAFAAAGYYVDPSWTLTSASGIARRGDLPCEPAQGVPYLSLAKDAVSFAYGNRLRGIGAFRLGVFSGEALSAPLTAANYILPESAFQTASVSGVAAALDLPLGRASLGFDGGAVVENGTLLGATYAGAASFGSGSPTYYAGVRSAVRLAPHLLLEGAAHLGVTKPSASAASLIRSTTDLLTTSFHLGLTEEDLTGRGDRLGVLVSQPLRVVSGTAHLYLPSAIDMEGAALYTPLDANLAADGQELDLQGFYATPLSAGAKLNLGAMLRLEPGNIRDARPDGVLMSRYQLAF